MTSAVASALACGPVAARAAAGGAGEERAQEENAGAEVRAGGAEPAARQ
jgi:hypothetical protein